MDLYTGTSSVSCASGTNTWTVNGTISMAGVFPGHKLWVGSRTASVPAAPLRMFRIATINKSANPVTFTTTDNADQTYSSSPFFIEVENDDQVGFANLIWTTVQNQLATMFGIGSTQYAGGGSQFALPRDVGASAVSELAFMLRSGATHTRSFFWRQRQVSGAEVLELIATPDGTTEIAVLSVNRTTGALTISGDQSSAVTLRGDAAYTILSTDRDIILNVAWTAGRTFTLPANSSRALNGRIRIIDGIAAINPGTPITITRAGSDTINGGTSITITKPRSVIEIIKTGTGQWTIDPAVLGDATERAMNAVLVTASNVVAAEVYDTRLDSDGGAWRHKCSHTSWYNEAVSATRGSRREFPLVAGIVAIGTSGSGNYTLTIYDLTDVDGAGVPRLWWQASSAAAGRLGEIVRLFGLNGRVYVAKSNADAGTTRGLGIINFAEDRAENLTSNPASIHHGTVPTVKAILSGSMVVKPTGAIGSNDVRDIYARVYPGAPLDQAGLPIPTVAVATAGGVSIIHPWGRVYALVYSTDSLNNARRVWLSPDGRVYWHSDSTGSSNIGGAPIPYADVSGTNTPERYTWSVHPAMPFGASGLKLGGIVGRPDEVLVAGHPTQGITFIARDPSAPSLAGTGMVSYVAINYATGWQPGDIRLAALCDTTIGNITGTAELVTNGSFTSDATGWTLGTDWSWSSGAATKVPGSVTANMTQNITTVVGQDYVLVADIVRSAGGITVQLVGTNYSYVSSVRAVLRFRATSTTTTIIFSGNAAFAGSVDNVSVKLAISDWSYRASGLHVIGTLTRTAVNTGNDLAAVSGFSGSNYLEQPYNPDMDFGTGDYAFVGWFRHNAAGRMFRRADTGLSGARIRLDINASNQLEFQAIDAVGSTAAPASTATVNDNAWHHFVACRRAGVTELWLDGVQVATSAAAAGSMTNTAAILRVGLDVSGGTTFGGSLALLRITATAPSPAQIARIYADEAPLFNAGAKACLGGTSSAVTDLDVDEARNVLVVATADGVSEFSGLNRTAYLDTANTALTNDSMKAAASAAGYRLLAGGAQAVVLRDTTNPFDAIARYGPRQPDRWRAFGRTTDATPTNLAPHIYVGERETVTFSVRVNARQVGGTATEYASYLVTVSAKRDAGGNVTVTNVTTTTQEVTAGMDAAAVAVTASQTIAIQVTGKTATTLVWTAEAVGPITRVTEEISYAA